MAPIKNSRDERTSAADACENATDYPNPLSDPHTPRNNWKALETDFVHHIQTLSLPIRCTRKFANNSKKSKNFGFWWAECSRN